MIISLVNHGNNSFREWANKKYIYRASTKKYRYFGQNQLLHKIVQLIYFFPNGANMSKFCKNFISLTVHFFQNL